MLIFLTTQNCFTKIVIGLGTNHLLKFPSCKDGCFRGHAIAEMWKGAFSSALTDYVYFRLSLPHDDFIAKCK